MPIGQPNPRFSGYSSFGQGTPKQVNVSTNSTQLLAANPNRLYAEVINNTANPIWIQKGIAAVVGQGIKVLSGGMLNFQGNELYLGALNAISQSGSVNVDVTEGV